MSQKAEDLRCKVVTSPDKLRASRSRLQEEVSEAAATVKDLESQQRMWEALSSRAQQVPEVRWGWGKRGEISGGFLVSSGSHQAAE